MATTALGWPRNAAFDRDAAAEAIVEALRELKPVASRSTVDEVTVRSLRAVEQLQIALRHLERQGASTRPAELDRY